MKLDTEELALLVSTTGAMMKMLDMVESNGEVNDDSPLKMTWINKDRFAVNVKSDAPDNAIFGQRKKAKEPLKLTVGELRRYSDGDWKIEFYNKPENRPDVWVVWNEHAKWINGRSYKTRQDALEDLLANYIMLLFTEVEKKREVIDIYNNVMRRGHERTSVPKFASKKLENMTKTQVKAFTNWCEDLHRENHLSPELISVLTGGVHDAKEIDGLIKALYTRMSRN